MSKRDTIVKTKYNWKDLLLQPYVKTSWKQLKTCYIAFAVSTVASLFAVLVVLNCF